MTYPQQPKRIVNELPIEELRAIVKNIQKLLWWQTLNANTESPSSYWDSGKEIDLDTLVATADTLDEHGFRPIDLPQVLGFNSVDAFIQRIGESLQRPADGGPDDYYD
jgi:hypothetical protein